MASIAEQLIGSALQSAQQVPDLSAAVARGGQLAEHMANIQNKRAQLELDKQNQEMQKFQRVGEWFDTYAKMPEGNGKKAFGKQFIPKGIGAFGLSEKIDPTVLEMMTGDSNLAAFLVSQVRNDPSKMGLLTQPDQVAAEYAKGGKQFGDIEHFKQTVQENLPQLQEAEKLALTEAGKAERAKTVSGTKEQQRGISNLTDLRKEVTGHPITKDTISKADSYDKIKLSFGGKPSAAGDISGVFAYMKLLDPQSTVREGEQAQARNAAGVPDIIQNTYNRLLKGETLTVDQRKDFLNRAEEQYRSQYEKQISLNKEFENIANETGIDPKLIFAGTKFKEPPKVKSEAKFSVSDEQKTKFAAMTPEKQEANAKALAEKFGVSVDEIKAALLGKDK